MSYAILDWGHVPQGNKIFALQRRDAIVRKVSGLKSTEDCKQYFINYKI